MYRMKKAAQWCAVICFWLAAGVAEAADGVAAMQDEIRKLQADISALSEMSNPSALIPARGRALLRIGGEINVDYTAALRERGANRNPDSWVASSAWALHSTNLRFTIDFGGGLEGRIKLDLSERHPYIEQQILEEAQLIWRNICGGPFGVIFGKGEIPYGQDRTLGIIQSYHHSEGSYSPEGLTVLNGPAPGMFFNDVSTGAGPVWHPGETDRVAMAGFFFDWQDTLRFEAAVFQPEDYPFPGRKVGDSGFESFSARLWWQTPVEGLVMELSGMRKYLRNRGDIGRFGPRAREDSYAFSFGIDYQLPEIPLELFAEYEMGIDWNFQTDYDTHTVSLGGLYQLTDKIELGLLGEWLRIDDRGHIWNYNKFVLHGKYIFSNHMYLIGEYGLETLNWGSATAHVFAIRSGIDF